MDRFTKPGEICNMPIDIDATYCIGAIHPDTPLNLPDSTPVHARIVLKPAVFWPGYHVNPVPMETPYKFMPPKPADAKLFVVSSPRVPPKPAPPVGSPSISHR